VLLVGRRGLNEEKDWGYYILHLVMSAVVGAVLLNAPFAPWRLLGQYRLLVTPYALLAVCYGYLTAYWFLLPAGWWKEDEVGWRVLLRRGAGWVFAAGAVALVGVAPFRNVEETDARPAAGVNAFARRVVERAAGRTWLVTDGALDNTLLLAAAELGRPLRLLDLRLGTNPMYMKYVSRHFENPRLRSLAEAGLVPLLKEWLASEPGVEARVAVMVIPDFWLAAGMHPLPNGLVFLGVRDRASVDLGAVWEGHRRLWAEPFVADLQATRQTCPLLAPLAGYLLRHAGMVANNLGVWLEDAARTNEAFAAYGEARRLDPANVSALLNQHGMIERGHVGADAPAVESAFRELAEHPPRKYPVWSLSRYYGYVRMPQAYANLGLSWALSGQPGMAVAGIKQAIELAPEGSGQLSQFLANLYLAQGQADAGEAVFRRLLEKEPENPAALIGMGRVAALRRDFAAAAEWLGRAEKAGVPGDRMAMEWAAMHTLAGSLDKARIALQELVEVKPDFAPAWAMLADVLLQQGDRQALDECERSLERLKTQDVLVAVVRAKVALARSDLSAARRFLAQALELNSASVPVLEMMLQLDIEDVQPEMAQRHVGMLLTVDPENALGNLILASLQIRRGEYLLAENSLRRSLATRRSFEALNDLAWVLQARGNLAEAETCAREALALTSVSHSPWDTLGVILMKAGRLDESGKALQRAATLAPESLAVQTHLAELYARQGQEERAAQLADQLLAFPGELTREDRDTLSQISRRVLIAGATNVPPARPAIPRF
jgi:tetratricopeptide (TPR) repeat protein